MIFSLSFPLNTTLFFVFPPQVQYLTLMGMELHARTRRDLEPDPEFDPICALFYCLSSDAPLSDVDSTQLTGAIMVDKDHQSCDRGENSFHQSSAEKEDVCYDVTLFSKVFVWGSHDQSLCTVRLMKLLKCPQQVTEEQRPCWSGRASLGCR